MRLAGKATFAPPLVSKLRLGRQAPSSTTPALMFEFTRLAAQEILESRECVSTTSWPPICYPAWRRRTRRPRRPRRRDHWTDRSIRPSPCTAWSRPPCRRVECDARRGAVGESHTGLDGDRLDRKRLRHPRPPCQWAPWPTYFFQSVFADPSLGSSSNGLFTNPASRRGEESASSSAPAGVPYSEFADSETAGRRPTVAIRHRPAGFLQGRRPWCVGHGKAVRELGGKL